MVRAILKRIDWILFFSTIPLLSAGLITMRSFLDEGNVYFERQIVWIAISLAAFFALSFIDFRFLRRTGVVVTIFLLGCAALIAVLIVGKVIRGSQSWFSFGLFSFQPSDPAKLVLVLLLAKYFSRRHIEIAHIRHILLSGLYGLIIFLLVFLQPDFGSAIIVSLIWFGMVSVSGISKKHLALVLAAAVVSFSALWFFVFEDYQKERLRTFIHPYTELRGAGYNAYQSTIAVGSGGIFGKGIGYGTQSRLRFLPEYQTDFIFAAFAEEWGFVGVILLFILFGTVIGRIMINAFRGATNFEILYGIGLAILFMSHFGINVGMNVGLLPITGTTMPFMSYGGSHLLTEFAGLGILMGMRLYSRTVHREKMDNEFAGP